MNRAVALAAAMLAAGMALAQDKPPAAAGQVCAACHAADGNSIAPANPKIAGQFAEYLGKQLRDFKAQGGQQPLRQSAVMNGMVANLSDADLKGLAAYYAGQALKPSARWRRAAGDSRLRRLPRPGRRRDPGTISAARGPVRRVHRGAAHRVQGSQTHQRCQRRDARSRRAYE
jgi:cytochrome c553